MKRFISIIFTLTIILSCTIHASSPILQDQHETLITHFYQTGAQGYNIIDKNSRDITSLFYQDHLDAYLKSDFDSIKNYMYENAITVVEPVERVTIIAATVFSTQSTELISRKFTPYTEITPIFKEGIPVNPDVFQIDRFSFTVTGMYVYDSSSKKITEASAAVSFPNRFDEVGYAIYFEPGVHTFVHWDGYDKLNISAYIAPDGKSVTFGTVFQGFFVEGLYRVTGNDYFVGNFTYRV